mmetsp:Transcript_34730/g.98409  ORF Transcript_34730/g.98409 Transcript_34730/m.98409 type:complete len:336 (-) Transcript_34730:1087-2094(-)
MSASCDGIVTGASATGVFLDMLKYGSFVQGIQEVMSCLSPVGNRDLVLINPSHECLACTLSVAADLNLLSCPLVHAGLDRGPQHGEHSACVDHDDPIRPFRPIVASDGVHFLEQLPGRPSEGAHPHMADVDDPNHGAPGILNRSNDTPCELVQKQEVPQNHVIVHILRGKHFVGILEQARLLNADRSAVAGTAINAVGIGALDDGVVDLRLGEDLVHVVPQTEIQSLLPALVCLGLVSIASFQVPLILVKRFTQLQARRLRAAGGILRQCGGCRHGTVRGTNEESLCPYDVLPRAFRDRQLEGDDPPSSPVALDIEGVSGVHRAEVLICTVDLSH